MVPFLRNKDPATGVTKEGNKSAVVLPRLGDGNSFPHSLNASLAFFPLKGSAWGPSLMWHEEPKASSMARDAKVDSFVGAQQPKLSETFQVLSRPVRRSVTVGQGSRNTLGWGG